MEGDELHCRLAAQEMAVGVLFEAIAVIDRSTAERAAQLLSACATAPMPPVQAALIEQLAGHWRQVLADTH